MGYGIRFLKKKEKEKKPVRERQTAEEIYGMPEGADLTRHLQIGGKLPQDQGREATRKLIQYAPKQPEHQGYYQNKQNSRENRVALDNARRLKQMKSYRQQLSNRLYAPNSQDEQQINSQGAENWRQDISRQVDTLDQRIQKMQGQQQQQLSQAFQKLRAYQSPEVRQAQQARQRQKELEADRENRLGTMEKTRQQLKDRLLYPTKGDLAEIDRAGQDAWQQRMQQDLDYLEKAIGKLKGQQGRSNEETYRQVQQAKAAELEDVLLAPDMEETIAKAALKSQNLLGGNYKMRRAARYLTDPDFGEKGQGKLVYREQQDGLLGSRDAKEDLDFLTDREKRTLLYYAGKGDWATMAQYYDTIERQLQQRRQESANQWAEDQANRHKVAGTVANIGASLFSPLAYGEALGQALTNKITGEDVPVNTASPLMAGAQLAQATQKGITRDMGPVGQFLTGTGLSIGQNLARMPLGPGAALGSMALGAAGSTALEAAERGAGAGQAATLGTLAGAAEALTEKIPLDNLFRLAREGGGEGLKGFLRSTLGQMGSEATEEVISEYANRLADNIILSDQSEMADYIRQLMDQGASAEQARKAAAREFWLKQPALAGLGGALSGGILGSGAQALNKANSAIDRFLRGPQPTGLPNPQGQVTMEQNEQEAARRRFLRKEAVNGGQQGQETDTGLGRGIYAPDYDQGTVELEADNAGGNRGIESSAPALEEGTGRIPAQTRVGQQLGGHRTQQIGECTYYYEETPQQNIVPEVQKMVEECGRRGVKAIVYDGEPEAEYHGRRSKTSAMAFTREDGTIMISSAAANSELRNQIVRHELLHSIKKTNFERYQQLEQNIRSLDLYVDGEIKVLDAIKATYGYDDLFSENSRLLEEVLAQLAGWHSEDPAFAREKFGPLFVDYDGVIAELEALDTEMLAQGQAALNSANDSDQKGPPPPSGGDSLALTQKGSAYLSRAEKQAADTIAKAMNIPQKAKRETLGPVMRQLAEQLARDGRLSAEAANSAFEAAYEQGLVVLDDFARQYDGLRRDLQRTRFQLSDQDKADIADYGDFRRRNFGRLNIVNQGGTPVDIMGRQSFRCGENSRKSAFADFRPCRRVISRQARNNSGVRKLAPALPLGGKLSFPPTSFAPPGGARVAARGKTRPWRAQRQFI